MLISKAQLEEPLGHGGSCLFPLLFCTSSSSPGCGGGSSRPGTGEGKNGPVGDSPGLSTKERDGLRSQPPTLDHKPVGGRICVSLDVGGTAWATAFSLLSSVAFDQDEDKLFKSLGIL